MKERNYNKMIIQKWEEIRNRKSMGLYDYSFHLSEKDRKDFIHNYWETLPKGSIPNEYSRPAGEPFETEAPDEILLKIKESQNGIWSNSIEGIENC